MEARRSRDDVDLFGPGLTEEAAAAGDETPFALCPATLAGQVPHSTSEAAVSAVRNVPATLHISGDAAATAAADCDFESESVLSRSLWLAIASGRDAPAPLTKCSLLSLQAAFRAVLRSVFGIASGYFREGQCEVIAALLVKRQSVLGVFPTGWGKSLCYQFPAAIAKLLHPMRHQALLHHERVDGGDIDVGGAVGASAGGGFDPTGIAVWQPLTIVIGPLLSLMEDQMSSIAGCGGGTLLSVTSISGTTALPRQRKLLLEAERGNIDVIFVSPERVVGNQLFRHFLKRVSHRILSICIDEVHCLSEWAHDFRPSYMYLRQSLAQLLGEPVVARLPFLGLTATASRVVREQVKAQLAIATEVVHLPERSNLLLEVVHIDGAFPSDVPESNDSQLRRIQWEAVRDAIRRSPRPALVYATTQADVDDLARFLRQQDLTPLGCVALGGAGQSRPENHEGGGYTFRRRVANGDRGAGGGSQKGEAAFGSAQDASRTVRAYHAGLSLSDRASAQRMFLRGEVEVLVATVAFGMGIDKSDIRAVVHSSVPPSVEAYVQETGRAGRDGRESACVLVFAGSEFFRHRSRLLGPLLSFAQVKLLLQELLCRGPRCAHGAPLALVHCARAAAEVGCSPETAETGLLMVAASHPRRVSVVAMHVPLGAKIAWAAAGEARDANRQRKLKQSAAAANVTGSVADVLEQLHVEDELVALCKLSPTITNLITTANSLRVPYEELLQRLEDLESSGFIRVRWGPRCHLASIDPCIDDAHVLLIAKEVYSKHKARVEGSVRRLEATFNVLSNPTHAKIANYLQSGDIGTPAATGDGQGGASEAVCAKAARPECPAGDGQARFQWSVPPPRRSKAAALELVDDFIMKERVRVESPMEAARVLCGVSCAGVAVAAAGEAALPLLGGWGRSSPYFGKLTDFEFAWVLRVCELSLQRFERL